MGPSCLSNILILILLKRLNGAVALIPWKKSYREYNRKKKQQLSVSEPWHMPSLIRSAKDCTCKVNLFGFIKIFMHECDLHAVEGQLQPISWPGFLHSWQGKLGLELDGTVDSRSPVGGPSSSAFYRLKQSPSEAEQII